MFDKFFIAIETLGIRNKKNENAMAPNRSDENPLTALIIDVSPVAWGDRDLRRKASDRKRQNEGKSSNGQPLILEELLTCVQAFASALVSLERDSALIIVAVAGNEVAVIHPRKDHLETFFSNTEMKQDTRKIQSDLIQGVSALVARAAKRIADPNHTRAASQAAMASAFSLALCLINRYLVATNAGVSALHTGHAWNRGNADDEGVIAAIGGGGKRKSSRKSRAWSPRVLMIQASDDRPGDYNAVMNCAFASVKHQIIVDGCFLRCDDENKSSALLEQTCDLTGGLFMPLSLAAQANKALTEVLLSVFLPPKLCRNRLNLPAINEVDFRARSFDSGKSVNMAFVCNQCLSIFEDQPKGHCPTCDAEIRSKKQRS